MPFALWKIKRNTIKKLLFGEQLLYCGDGRAERRSRGRQEWFSVYGRETRTIEYIAASAIAFEVHIG